MNYLPLRFALAAAVVFVAALVASPGPSPAAGAGGLVSVSAWPITGQQGKYLVIHAHPQEGADKAACTLITEPIFEGPGLKLKELQGDDPCAPGAPDALVPDGTLTVTAGIYRPGSQVPEKQVTATYEVNGGGAFGIDGIALTANTVGDADCNRTADAVDALHVLRDVAGLPTSASCLEAGNVKCDDGFSSVDALFILRHVAALPVSVPAACPAPLAAPALVSPEDGARPQLPGAPWLVPLDWDPIAGAAGYTVEVDCEHCCAIGFYCGDVGRTYRSEAGIQTTEHTPSLSGANKHRWRVWALNEDGTPGDFSPFRTFDIDVVPALR